MDLSTLFLFAAVIAAPSNPIEFDIAQKNAEESGRPLVVLVGAEWCGACRVMKDSTMQTVANDGGLEHAEYSYVDYDKKRNVATKIMKGDRVPQLVKYERHGSKWVIIRYAGSFSDAKSVKKFIVGK